MILAVLQARMSSTRLPGKVLMPLLGEPMLARQIARVRRARRLDRLVVATSTGPDDDAVANAARAAGAEVCRGPLDDVLARFILALDAFPAEHVVRLTGDCPLADPQVIDATVALHLERAGDYTSNTPATYAFPKGLDVEVITAAALRRAAARPSPEAREHVTWDVWNRPDRHRLAWLRSARSDDGEIRWTVDRPDDFAFVQAVYEGLHPHDSAFTAQDVRAFVGGRPDLAMFGGDRRL